jgi:threonine dehydrogenase-like Zn-dependent dehydrogenase
MMRAARLAAPRRAEVVQVPPPAPAAGEVRISIAGCGVCASNIEPWEGPDWMQFPTIPGGLGHEAWGRIDAVGAGVAKFAVGDPVAFLGEQGFAEQEVVAASHVLPIPPELAGLPLAAEPIGCAFNIFRRADIRAGQWVAIIGIGFLGAILSRLASDAGARVIALSRRQYSRDLARAHGAALTIAMDDHWRIIEQVQALTGGALCPRVIEATGHQWPLDLAGELVAEGGRLVIAGYHQDGPRQINMQQWNWKGIDVVNAHERRLETRLQGMREAIAAVADGRIDLARLITHRLPLDALDAALTLTRDRPDGFVKAVVVP